MTYNNSLRCSRYYSHLINERTKISHGVLEITQPMCNFTKLDLFDFSLCALFIRPVIFQTYLGALGLLRCFLQHFLNKQLRFCTHFSFFTSSQELEQLLVFYTSNFKWNFCLNVSSCCFFPTTKKITNNYILSHRTFHICKLKVAGLGKITTEPIIT